MGIAGDISNESGVSALAEQIGRRFPRLSILVNNAGKTWGAPLETFPHAAWEKIFSVNVAGLFTLTQRLMPQLTAAATADDPARIINLGSVMGNQPMGDGAYSYAASKAAVHHLTRILAKELAARRITVNALAPGVFDSRMTAFATRDPCGWHGSNNGFPWAASEGPKTSPALFFSSAGAAALTLPAQFCPSTAVWGSTLDKTFGVRSRREMGPMAFAQLKVTPRGISLCA